MKKINKWLRGQSMEARFIIVSTVILLVTVVGSAMVVYFKKPESSISPELQKALFEEAKAMRDNIIATEKLVRQAEKNVDYLAERDAGIKHSIDSMSARITELKKQRYEKTDYSGYDVSDYEREFARKARQFSARFNGAH